MKLFLSLAIGTCAIFFSFLSCKKELSCEGCNEPSANKPPVANAGNDQNILLPTDSVLLNGEASTDPDGSITAFSWRMLSPSTAVIVNAQQAKTMVRNLAAGVYAFELTVKDNADATARDTVQVLVADPAITNRPPVACAGADQYLVLPASTLVLDGSCSADPDNNIAGYQWSVLGAAGAVIATPNTVRTDVSNLSAGQYQFVLKVTDAAGLFSYDTLLVTVSASPVGCTMPNMQETNAQLVHIGNLSQPRHGVAVVVAGNKIFYAGGYNNSGTSSRVDIYDVSINTWATAALSVPRYSISAVAAGGKVFFAGGIVAHNNSYVTQSTAIVDIFDLSTNTWSVAQLMFPGWDIAGAAVGNKVVFAGGASMGSERGWWAEIYDLVTHTWSAAILYGYYEGGHTAISVGSKLYIAGGGNNGGYTRIDIYDSQTQTLSAPSSLMSSRGHFSSAVIGNKIYWGGGSNGDWMSGVNSTMEIRDVTTGTSTQLPVALMEHYSKHTGFEGVVQHEKLVFPHGWLLNCPQHNLLVYDPQANSWTKVNLPLQQEVRSLVSVNNQLYAIMAPNGVNAEAVYKVVF